MLKITFKRLKRSLIEVYSIAERRVKLSNKTPIHRKIFIAFADNIGLTIRSDLVRFEHIMYFPKIYGNLIP